MSNKRIKIPALAPPATREEMERLAGEIADAKILQQDYTARMNAGIADVKSRYEALFGDLEERLAEMMERARAWADAHPAEFGKARSIEMTHAVVGFRTGQPQLKLRSGWTWERVLRKIQDFWSGEGYVRTKSEVDKQAILNQREALGTQIGEMGLRVVQEETFFVDPKLQEVEKREEVKSP